MKTGENQDKINKQEKEQPAADMQLPFALLVIPLNSVTSENLVPTKKEPQTGNPGSKFSDTNKHGEVRSGHFTSGSASLQHSSGNIDGEEPLLYGFFPDGFIWGAATSALQVPNQAVMRIFASVSLISLLFGDSA